MTAAQMLEIQRRQQLAAEKLSFIENRSRLDPKLLRKSFGNYYKWSRKVLLKHGFKHGVDVVPLCALLMRLRDEYKIPKLPRGRKPARGTRRQANGLHGLPESVTDACRALLKELQRENIPRFEYVLREGEKVSINAAREVHVTL